MRPYHHQSSNNKGFAALFITLLITTVFLAIALSITFLTIGEQRMERNIIGSAKAYYVAEAGIEDSIYRIVKGKIYEVTNGFSVGEGATAINISGDGDAKTIRSSGTVSQRTKVLSVSISTSAANIAFHYGAQIDKGGLKIGANANVIGNVYSNGNMEGQGKGSGSKITGDALVAGATAPDPDQEWISKDSDFPLGLKSGSIYYLDTAQSFVPSVSKVLNRVSFYLKKVGSPPDQTIRVLTDDNGKPSQFSLASATLRSSKVTASYSWTDVSLDTPPNLVAGQRYWILIDVNRDDDNYWVWGKDNSGGYPSGTGKYARDWNAPHTSWTDVGGDLNFKTWMGGETPTYMKRVWVGKDAHANTIIGSWIDYEAFYQTIDDQTRVGPDGQVCPNPNCYPNSPDPAPKDLPISYAQIQDWEVAAESGGIITCPYSGPAMTCAVEGAPCVCRLSAGASLGPIKIEGDLIFPSNSTDNPVEIAGPVWTTGKISASNSTGIKLKTNIEFGYTVIADNPTDQINAGKIDFNNNVVTQDSNKGGKLLFISTNKSLDPVNPAIWLYNNINKDKAQSIIFSLQGLIKVENNAKFIEVTGYAISLENNSEIVYEKGLINSSFSSGPGGGWKVTSWREVE